jgi:ribonucleotide monophosphatase NagD (HAD superfamily)
MDTQVLLDVVFGSGCVSGPISRSANENREARFPIYFCNPDLLWRSNFPRSRLGQGAFIHTFHNLYNEVGFLSPLIPSKLVYLYFQVAASELGTGKRLYESTVFGKPTTATFEFAARVMESRIESLNGRKVRKYEQPTL